MAHSFGGAICVGAVMLIASSAQAQNLFVSQIFSDNIIEITPDGAQTTFAPGAGLNGLAFNRAGDLFVANLGAFPYVGGNFITKITPGGAQSTFASGLNDPLRMAFDSAGNLFVGNYGNGTITEITPGGVESIFASGLSGPSVLAFDSAGNLFEADVGSGNIYEFAPDGTRSTFAPGLSVPSGLAFNRAGDLFVASTDGNIYEYTPGGVQSTFASEAGFPEGMAFNSAGDLFVADYTGFIYKFTPGGVRSVFASGLNAPFDLAFQPSCPAQVQTIYIGNSLDVANGSPDGIPPLVILGEYSPAGPLDSSAIIFPDAGKVTAVDFFGADYDFTLYALRHVEAGPNAGEQTFVVVASQTFSGSAATPGYQSLQVSDFHVGEGDFLAFAGIGPWYPQNPNDAPDTDATYEDSADPSSFAATPPGGPGTVFTVGAFTDPSATYEYISDYYGNQGRTYAIGVEFEPTQRGGRDHGGHDHGGHKHGGHDDGGHDHGDHGDHGRH